MICDCCIARFLFFVFQNFSIVLFDPFSPRLLLHCAVEHPGVTDNRESKVIGDTGRGLGFRDMTEPWGRERGLMGDSGVA